MSNSTQGGRPALVRRSPNVNDIRPFDKQSDAVVLNDGSVALVDRQDRMRLEARGLVGRWFLNPGRNESLPYVRTQAGDNLVTVARVIVGARKGEKVKYKNGSRLDLRRRNLEVVSRPVAPAPALLLAA